jgi:signal transduction histidine kinase
VNGTVQVDTRDLSAVRAGRLELIERTADTLAHAIKNPLHAMVINLEVLRRRVLRAGTDDQDELLRYVDILSGELQRVNQRVELLLRLSRGGGGETSLAEILESSADLLRIEAEAARVRLELRCDPRLARVRMGSEPARQLLLSLVLDAIAAVSEGGEVTVVAGFEAGVRHVSIHARDRTGAAVSLANGDAYPDRSRRMDVARAIAGRWGGAVEVLDSGMLLEFPPPA